MKRGFKEILIFGLTVSYLTEHGASLIVAGGITILLGVLVSLVSIKYQKFANGLDWLFNTNMLNFFLIIGLAIVVVTFIDIGIGYLTEKPTKSPEVILRDYYKAIENEDFETVKKLSPMDGINEDITNSNEEFYKKEMVKWASGFRARGGFERVLFATIKESFPFEDKITVLGITIWTKSIRCTRVDFTLFVNDGFVGMVPDHNTPVGIVMKAFFYMTKEGWKLGGSPEPGNLGIYDFLDKWLG